MTNGYHPPVSKNQPAMETSSHEVTRKEEIRSQSASAGSEVAITVKEDSDAAQQRAPEGE